MADDYLGSIQHNAARQVSLLRIQEAVAKFQSLQHYGSVTHYADKFECMAVLKREHPYLQETFFRSCFIGGLKSNIQHQVTCHQPNNLLKAYWYAKHIELASNYKRVIYNAKPNSAPSGANNNHFQKEVSQGGEKIGRMDRDKKSCWYCQEP